MLEQSRQPVLSTGCAHLDRALGGGVRAGITEISGESASGKTQLVMQLLLQAQLPTELGGLDGAALYLTTEGALPETRLVQMMRAYQARHEWTRDYDFRDSIFFEQLDTLDAQRAALFVKLPHLLRTEAGAHVRLVVLDSITALFRGGDAGDTATTSTAHNNAHSLRARAASFFALAAHLRRLSEEHAMPIVVRTVFGIVCGHGPKCVNILIVSPRAFSLAHRL